MSNPQASPARALRLQTNFDEEVGTGQSGPTEEDCDLFDSADEFDSKSVKTPSRPRFTAEEEKQVVRKFDRKLVPFLALLYLLAFLDRSSKFSCLMLAQGSSKRLMNTYRYRKCQDCRAARRSGSFV